jgi:ABC-type nitrate/sulfonate/bicarbonate transport system substrate-binding protein
MRFLALLALVLALTIPAGAQNAPLTELSVAINSPTAVELDLFIAEKQGFFREQGLRVTLITGGSPANVINLVSSGSVGIAADSTDPVMGAIARGLPIKFIAPGFQTDPYTLVTAGSITDWSQLKGKTVLIGPKLDVTGISLSRMAQAHHMTMDDFNLIVSTSTTARFAALTSGNAAAAMLNQPYDIVAESKGMHLLAASHDYVKDWLFEGFVVNTSWLAANRPIAVRFLRAIRKAIQFGYAHPDESIAILTAVTNIDPAIAKKSYDLNWRQWKAFDPNLRFNVAGLRAVAQGAVGSGILPSMPDVTTFYDASVAAEATR